MPAPKTTKGIAPGTVRGRYRLKTVVTVSKTTGRKVRAKRWVLTAQAKAAAKKRAAAKRRTRPRR